MKVLAARFCRLCTAPRSMVHTARSGRLVQKDEWNAVPRLFLRRFGGIPMAE